MPTSHGPSKTNLFQLSTQPSRMGRTKPEGKTRHLHNRPRLATTIQAHDTIRSRNSGNARGSQDSKYHPNLKTRGSDDWDAARSRLQPETPRRRLAQLAPLLLQRNRLRIQFWHSKHHFLNKRFCSLFSNGELGPTRLRGWLAAIDP